MIERERLRYTHSNLFDCNAIHPRQCIICHIGWVLLHILILSFFFHLCLEIILYFLFYGINREASEYLEVSCVLFY